MCTHVELLIIHTISIELTFTREDVTGTGDRPSSCDITDESFVARLYFQNKKCELSSPSVMRARPKSGDGACFAGALI